VKKERGVAQAHGIPPFFQDDGLGSGPDLAAGRLFLNTPLIHQSINPVF
jgi:hypothetical protein